MKLDEMRLYWIHALIDSPQSANPANGESLNGLSPSALFDYPRRWVSMCEVFDLDDKNLICNYKPVLTTARIEDINPSSEFARHLATLERDSQTHSNFVGSDLDAVKMDIREVFPHLRSVEIPPITAERCLVCGEPLEIFSTADGMNGVCKVCGAPYSKLHEAHGKVWNMKTWTLSIKPEWLQTFRSYWREKRTKIPPVRPYSGFNGIPPATVQENMIFAEWMNRRQKSEALDVLKEFRDSLNALA